MPYLLDTDWCIDALAGKLEALTLVDELMGDGVAISIITYMEIVEGIERSPSPDQAKRQFESFLEPIRLLPFTIRVAERCATLRHTLRKKGRRVNSRALDLLNAATAIDSGLDLVTRNIDDYDDIPRLTLYKRT